MRARPGDAKPSCAARHAPCACSFAAQRSQQLCRSNKLCRSKSHTLWLNRHLKQAQKCVLHSKDGAGLCCKHASTIHDNTVPAVFGQACGSGSSAIAVAQQGWCSSAAAWRHHLAGAHVLLDRLQAAAAVASSAEAHCERNVRAE